MDIALDTSAMVALVSKNHAKNEWITIKVWELQNAGHRLILSPNCLIEFYVVATRPISVNGLGMNHHSVMTYIDFFESVFQFIPETEAVFPHWKVLVKETRLIGKVAHDARLAAWMRSHQIETILTLNPKDFARMGIVTVPLP